MAGMNLNLLAGLVEQMNRMTELVRLRKILHKKPENRTVGDLERLMEESAPMGLLAKRGPAAHKDMCYGLHLFTIEEDEIGSFQSLPGKGELYCMVMSGQIWVETENMAPFNGKHDDAGKKKDSGKKVTDEEMEDLFNSIDADGSGAIDVEELSYALEMMGMPMAEEKVQELMDSVDDDGSGELEIDEFKLILKDKLGIGKEPTSQWETKGGKSSKYYGVGSVLGEESITGNSGPMTGKIMGTEDADICFISKATYLHILEHGFGGDLTRKQDLLRGHAIVQHCIRRSDLKRIAHACQLMELDYKETLCQQGGIPTDLIFLCEGTCKVQKRRDASDSKLGRSLSKFETRKNIKDLRKDGMKQFRLSKETSHAMVDLAILQAGDLVGTNVMLPEDPPHEYTVVTIPKTTVLKLAKKDLLSLLHPADVQALREAVSEITERRSKQSKANDESIQNFLRRTQSFKQAASTMGTVKKVMTEMQRSKSLGEGVSFAEDGKIDEDMGEDMEEMIEVASKKPASLTRLRSDLKDMYENDDERQVMKSASVRFKEAAEQVIGIRHLSTNPRKLKQQLKQQRGSAARLQQSRSERWDKLSNSMKALKKLKQANQERTSVTMGDMVKSIKTGKVSLDAMLHAFQTMQDDAARTTKETSLEQVRFEDLLEISLANMQGRRSSDSQTTKSAEIWSMGNRMELPPPPLKYTPRNPKPGADSIHELSKMLAPRPKQKAAHIDSISVHSLGKDPAHIAQDLNAFTSYLLVENDGMKPMPWRKEKPARPNIPAQNNTGMKRIVKRRITNRDLSQLGEVLDKTIERGVDSETMKKAGITVGHLKKLKQSIRVIMFISRASGSTTKRIAELELDSEGDDDETSEGGEDDDPWGAETEGEYTEPEREEVAEEEEEEEASRSEEPQLPPEEAAGRGPGPGPGPDAAPSADRSSVQVPGLNLAAMMRSRRKSQEFPAEPVSTQGGSEDVQPAAEAGSSWQRSPAYADVPKACEPIASRGSAVATPLTGWATDRADNGRTLRAVLPPVAAAAPAARSAVAAAHSSRPSRSRSVSPTKGRLVNQSRGKAAQPIQASAPDMPQPAQDPAGPGSALDHRDLRGFATHRPSAMPREPGIFSRHVRANPTPDDVYGISFAPNMPAHWTPRGGRESKSLPALRDLDMSRSSSGIKSMLASPGLLTTSANGGFGNQAPDRRVARASTGMPRPKVIMAGGWYTDRREHSQVWAAGEPGPREPQAQRPKPGAVCLNSRTFNAGAIVPSTEPKDHGKAVLRTKCFNSRIL